MKRWKRMCFLKDWETFEEDEFGGGKMDTESIKLLKAVSDLYTRRHMFEMMDKRASVIDDKMNEIAERELENEEYAIEELIALGR